MTTAADFPDGIDVMLLSVPHTGTRFLRKLIEPTFNLHTHPSTGLGKTRAMLKISRLIVCPLRDPAKVWESFCRKGLSDGQFWLSWARLWHLSHEFSIYYMPIDVSESQDRLNLLGEILGRPLKTDWAPVGHEPQHQGEIREHDLADLYAIPFIKRWYG